MARRCSRSATTSSRSTRAILQHPRVVGGQRAPRRLHRPDGRLPHVRASASAPTTSTSCQCPQKPSKHPGEGPDCDLTEARDFNLMFETTVGPVKDSGSVAYLRPETAQGIFINFKNVLQFTPQEAAVRHRAGRQVVPQRDHAGQLHLPHARVRADGDGVLRPAGRGRRVVRATGSERDALVREARHPPRPPAPARARRRRAQPLLVRHRRRRVPLPDRLVASSRASPTAATSTSASTPSSAARSSSTSTRAAASATSRTSSSPPPAPTARRSPSSSTPTTRRRSRARRAPCSTCTRAWRR